MINYSIKNYTCHVVYRVAAVKCTYKENIEMTQSILVTGSNSGFGRLTVETLAQDGHTVFASMRNVKGKNANAAKELQTWAQKEGVALYVVELDVTDDTSMTQAVKQVIDTAGRIDVVVNNAGVAYAGVTEGFTLEQAKAQFEVNVFGPLRVNKAVLPHMRKQGSGLLIHISSTIGRLTMPFMGLYCASKFAVEAFAESYYHELQPLGIDAIIVEPGAFPTELGAKIGLPADEQILNAYGELANAPQKMSESLEKLFSGPDAPNPQGVADAVKRLIDMSQGERPLRTVVDPLTGQFTEAVNEVSARSQPGLLQSFGVST
jgi:NAD(P)-dependent dehydrogenase (short-subunit alcohol dehydrogenase family)